MEKKKETRKVYAGFASKNKQQLFDLFQTTQKGLSSEQVENLRETYGNNSISYGKKTPFIVEVIKAFITPFTLVLIALGIISFITEYLLAAPADKDLFGVIIIFAMVLVSGTMTLIQSVRSNQAAEKLKSLVKVTAAVKRDGEYKEIPMEEIVCGDQVRLSAGDMIPADMRLLSAKDLFISQAALTGESYPVEKHATVCSGRTQSETSYENIAFMGSNVISGSAEGIIISVGNDTMFGHVAQNLSQKPIKTSFELGIQKTSMLLIKFMALMAPTVIVINGFTKGDWLEAFLFGLSVAVGLTPEMLPMIVTTNLVKGASAMAKKGTVIKNLNAIQNFGAIDVLCTDKTGTLTQDKIILEYHMDCEGNENDRVLRHAYLNSYYQTGLKNLLDVAIIDEAVETLDTEKIRYQKVDEIPFDFERRRMSVVVADPAGKTQMITKGAIEEMLSISSYIDLGGEVKPLTAEQRETVLAKVKDLNEDGLRVIGVAQKTNPSVVGEFSVKDESEMVLIGYLAFLDPPKETTKQALKALKDHGVAVKVLTGDNELVTRSVCRQVGLQINELITGEKIAEMSDKELGKVAEAHDVFVKLNPQQKARLTTALRNNGHTVGFLGDGINDAPAMKVADIGISVDTAVDIAKESADVILLEKDLMILEKGLLSGRETFGNIMKYIKATASSNFGNMFSVLVASTFLPFLPMLPLQILFLNLIYDVSCISLPWDRMDKEYLHEPKKWEASSIGKFMVYFGPTSSVFDITTYLLMYFVICPAVVGGSYHTLTGSQQVLFIALFHAGWFVESLWTQTLVLHALRTPKVPFLQSNATFIMFSITTLGILVGSVLPFTNFGEGLGLLPLPGNYWIWLIVTVIAYLGLVTFMKKIYINKFGELL
ncbi:MULTISPECIES: magnesium-translocating P-type ATPase [Enterococcus]|uniref:Magnesium-transporting ATPase, P-type 1 n=1 Tax=Enterococcus mundtii TaxID=53346 RepID=A0A1L8UTE3_ENTMU|nr:MULTISPECIES: magnesium-translocating P-type ATPase [Enterococcus]GEN18964.1 magnesium-translocating P-type ATPase [Ligilactobacillus acidipiscis]AUB53444.1 magnesium-translocating P-type ATPase [Enterococcus mundtii]MDB7088679.1 magnesium-translocating P-type ATPase [Enterococcus mundtii]MZZ58459.1 magnesium-translocating P-type ATPase [Enterococcus mundtii]MZZ61725.1 magnesium-translocating P-type ATPase [Enterococcus mundtii]